MFIFTDIVVKSITKPENWMDWTGSKTDFLKRMVIPNDVSKFIVALTFWSHCSFDAPCKYELSTNVTDRNPCFCKTGKAG